MSGGFSATHLGILKWIINFVWNYGKEEKRNGRRKQSKRFKRKKRKRKKA